MVSPVRTVAGAVSIPVIVNGDIITGGAAGTITFQLVSDSTDTIATDGSQTVHFRSKAFVTDDAALNDLDAGAGRMGEATQYTVNNQMVNATLIPPVV